MHACAHTEDSIGSVYKQTYVVPRCTTLLTSLLLLISPLLLSSWLQSECEFYSGLRSQSFRVVASQQWTRGQEVFINYGSGSNDALLQLYGFVEANNTDDRCVHSLLLLVEGGSASGGVHA